jgi:hypothetical protein
VHGGAVFEPMTDLINVLGTLVDGTTGDVLVPGFYENVVACDAVEKGDDAFLKSLADLPLDLEGYRASVGAEKLTSGNRAELLRKKWLRPTLSIHGIRASSNARSVIAKAVFCDGCDSLFFPRFCFCA